MSPQVLFVSSEIPPWIKSGGLGDVTAALPHALCRAGTEVRVLVPGYRAVLDACAGQLTEVAVYGAPGGQLPAARVLSAGEVNGAALYVVECAALYDRDGGAYHDVSGVDWVDSHLRFGLLSRIAASVARWGLGDGFKPDVLHCNDWPSGLAPAYLRWDGVDDVTCVMSIHNVSHQGIYPPAAIGPLGVPAHAFNPGGVEFYGNLSFLKAGLIYADHIVAVSPRYALEMQTPESGYGMDGVMRARAPRVLGILNGIDTEVWNPATDRHLAANYDRDTLPRKRDNKFALQRRCGLPERDDVLVLGVVSRLAFQKGLDLLLDIAERLHGQPVQLIVLGSGDAQSEAGFRALAERHPDWVHTTIGFDESLAHQIEAGADAFVMPSRFEPCGLNQMYSLRYGTLPIVRATGGLLDTVVDLRPDTLAAHAANGFVFEATAAEALLVAIHRALEAWQNRALWRSLQRNAMARDFSWRASAAQYQALYAGGSVSDGVAG